MVTKTINLNSAYRSCIDTLFVNARFCVCVVLLLPAMLHADGLFDFQMKMAEKGNAEAEYKVGEMYETGFGVEKNMTEAASWITKSAEQGHEKAGFKLLYWDIKNNGLTDANKEKIESLKSKAKTGNPHAQYYVGKMYAYGVGVKKDLNKAISWLNKAALFGALEAERELIIVRENKQRAVLDKRRTEEKQRVQLKAKKKREKLAREKARAKKKAATERAKNISRRDNAATDVRTAAEVEAAEQAAILAQKKAEARKRELQKRALLKKREADERNRKARFESDPCSGKSARFLSTCR